MFFQENVRVRKEWPLFYLGLIVFNPSGVKTNILG